MNRLNITDGQLDAVYKVSEPYPWALVSYQIRLEPT